MRRPLRQAWAIGVVALCLPAPCPPAATQTVPGGHEALVEQLYALSGAELSLAHAVAMARTSPVIQDELGLSPNVAAILSEVLLDAYTVEVLRRQLLDALSTLPGGDRLQAALRFLQSPVRRKLLALTGQAADPRMAQDFRVFAAELSIRPPSTERLELIEKIDLSLGTQVALSQGLVHLYTSLAKALDAVQPAGHKMAPSQFGLMAQAFQAEVEATTKDLARALLLFAFRTATDADLTQMVTQAQASEGRWLNKNILRAMAHALERGAAVVGLRMVQELLRLRTGLGLTEDGEESYARPEPAYDEMPLGFWRRALLFRDPGLRLKAAVALRMIGPAAAVAVPDLVRAMRDSNGQVRRAAAHAIAEIAPRAGVETVIPTLVKALTAPEPAVRWHMTVALGLFGAASEPAVPRLVKMVLSDPPCAPAAADALGQIGESTRPVVPLLIQELQTTDPHRRRWVVRALGAIGTHAHEALPHLRKMRAGCPPDHVLFEELEAAVRKVEGHHIEGLAPAPAAGGP